MKDDNGKLVGYWNGEGWHKGWGDLGNVTVTAMNQDESGQGGDKKDGMYASLALTGAQLLFNEIAVPLALAEPTPFGEIFITIVNTGFLAYNLYHNLEFAQMKGERGWQSRSDGTDNPYKKWKNDPFNLKNVLKPKNDGKGNYQSVPKPSDWDYWKTPTGGNKKIK